MRPIRWLAASVARVSLASLASLVLVVLVSIGVAAHVRHSSTSPGADLFWLTLSMLALLGAAALQAVWIGELVFRQPWCRYFLTGEGTLESQSANELDFDAIFSASVQKNARRKLSVLVALCVLASLFLVNRATGGFFDEYARVGYYRTALRGASPDARAQLLLELADRSTDEVSEWVDSVIAPRLDSADAPERVDALRALWWVARRMGRSVDLLNQANARTDRWEYALAQQVRQQVAPRVLGALRAESTDERVAAARLLGEVRSKDFVAALSLMATNPDQGAAERTAAAIALGRSTAEEAFEPLTKVVQSAQTPSAVLDAALWALGELAVRFIPSDSEEFKRVTGREWAPSAGLDAAAAALREGLPNWPPPTRCVAAGALQRIGDSRAFGALTTQFEAEGSTFSCPAIELVEWKGPPLVLSQAEPYRLALLRAVAEFASGDDAVESWAGEQKRRKDYYSPAMIGELESLHGKVKASLE